MKLYEIDAAILNCIDTETGEILDEEQLSQLQMERDQKIENVALWVKNLNAEKDAVKAEKDAFASRQKALENRIDSLKSWLTFATEGQKFSSPKCQVSFRRSESVNVLDPELIPAEYMVITVEKKPDKVTIKEQLKNGFAVPGCSLETKQNIQIR